MKKNMGPADRIVRIIIAAVVAYLYYNGTITDALGIVLLVIAGIFVLTGLVGFCPVYKLVGLNTCPAKRDI